MGGSYRAPGVPPGGHRPVPAGHCGSPHSPPPPGCPPELAARALRAVVPPRPVAVNTGWNLLLVKDSLLENHRPHCLNPQPGLRPRSKGVRVSGILPLPGFTLRTICGSSLQTRGDGPWPALQTPCQLPTGSPVSNHCTCFCKLCTWGWVGGLCSPLQRQMTHHYLSPSIESTEEPEVKLPISIRS